MGGQIEAQHLEFPVQLFRGQPRRDRREAQTLPARSPPPPPNMSRLAARLVFLRALGKADDAVETADQLGAVVAEAIEGAGADQAFEHAAVDQLRIDAQAEILEACERPVAAHLDDVLDRGFADALDGGQRVIDAACRRSRNGGRRSAPTARTTSMPRRAGILAEVVDLVGVGHIERHRRGEELDRIMRLHDRRSGRRRWRRRRRGDLLKP